MLGELKPKGPKGPGRQIPASAITNQGPGKGDLIPL
jgi:hypothetical protein